MRLSHFVLVAAAFSALALATKKPSRRFPPPASPASSRNVALTPEEMALEEQTMSKACLAIVWMTIILYFVMSCVLIYKIGQRLLGKRATQGTLGPTCPRSTSSLTLSSSLATCGRHVRESPAFAYALHTLDEDDIAVLSHLWRTSADVNAFHGRLEAHTGTYDKIRHMVQSPLFELSPQAMQCIDRISALSQQRTLPMA